MGEFDPAALVHSKIALLRSRLNDTMVRLAELPIRTKSLCPMPNIIWFLGAPGVDKNHNISKKLPLHVGNSEDVDIGYRSLAVQAEEPRVLQWKQHRLGYP